MNVSSCLMYHCSSLTGDAGECEEMQELPLHADQASITQCALPRYLQECEGPGAGPAGELLSDPPLVLLRPSNFQLTVCMCVQDAKIEPEEFTTRLQAELKSSPQPYLIPFLKV